MLSKLCKNDTEGGHDMNFFFALSWFLNMILVHSFTLSMTVHRKAFNKPVGFFFAFPLLVHLFLSFMHVIVFL